MTETDIVNTISSDKQALAEKIQDMLSANSVYDYDTGGESFKFSDAGDQLLELVIAEKEKTAKEFRIPHLDGWLILVRKQDKNNVYTNQKHIDAHTLEMLKHSDIMFIETFKMIMYEFEKQGLLDSLKTTPTYTKGPAVEGFHCAGCADPSHHHGLTTKECGCVCHGPHGYWKKYCDHCSPTTKEEEKMK